MRNPPRNLPLEALLEERDHLKIQISLLEHGPRPDPAALDKMRSELEAIERRISARQTPL
jgi:predicted  nucleic acid-binding Zn-ribbon protein